MEGNDPTKEIKRTAAFIPATNDDDLFATTLLRNSGIIGWHLSWETYRDSSGNFFTKVDNPLAEYKISCNNKMSIMQTEKTSKNKWSVLNILHGFAGEMPNAPLMIFWSVYTYICGASVLFSIISGIYLWANTNKQKKMGWLIFAGTFCVSFLLMLYVYYYG